MENELLETCKDILIFSRSGQNNNRSAAKVDELHGIVSSHLQACLGDDYFVETKLTNGKETKIQGRYIDKKVDIVIRNVHTKKIVAGIGAKMPLNTYGKNRINYFENMLGETANIRSNNIPYFQILILPLNIPDFAGDTFKTYYTFDEEKLELYKTLSRDNALAFYHTPIKMLIFIVDDKNQNIPVGLRKSEYNEQYIENIKDINIEKANINIKDGFDTNVIFNDYEKFVQKLVHIIIGFD